MHLIQILLPLQDNEGKPYPRAIFDVLRESLTRRFGGVTAFMRSPAQGAWMEEDRSVNHDDVVVMEVMALQLDRVWWAEWRCRLEREMGQKEIVVRATRIERL